MPIGVIMKDLAAVLFDLIMDLCLGRITIDEARDKAIKARQEHAETVSDETLEWMDDRIAELEAAPPNPSER
jgi:hypothetical protein